MRKIFLSAILLCLMASFSFGKNADRSTTQITADRMVTESEKGRIRFIGHVEANHKDIQLKADEVEVYSDEKKESVTSIIANGNVVVTRGTKQLVGKHAELDYVKKVVTVTGNPEIKEKDNRISGEKIVYQYDKEGIIIEGGSGKKATLILPMPKKDKKN